MLITVFWQLFFERICLIVCKSLKPCSYIAWADGGSKGCSLCSKSKQVVWKKDMRVACLRASIHIRIENQAPIDLLRLLNGKKSWQASKYLLLQRSMFRMERSTSNPWRPRGGRSLTISLRTISMHVRHGIQNKMFKDCMRSWRLSL